jgi:RNAse (barnase) inhibitor barstar
MSGLAGLLAHKHPSGVYQWHTAFAPADVQHTVEHAGWRFAYVDGWTHQDKESFLDSVAEALSFPDHFGKNFDALADCLRDLTGAGLILLWDGWAPLARSDPSAFDTAIDVFSARATDDPANPFSLLLRGEGPSIGIPLLDA